MLRCQGARCLIKLRSKGFSHKDQRTRDAKTQAQRFRKLWQRRQRNGPKTRGKTSGLIIKQSLSQSESCSNLRREEGDARREEEERRGKRAEEDRKATKKLLEDRKWGKRWKPIGFTSILCIYVNISLVLKASMRFGPKYRWFYCYFWLRGHLGIFRTHGLADT